MSFREPDLSGRPYKLETKHCFQFSPDRLFRAWTDEFDLWFAAPGSLLMTPRLDSPFFFETEKRFENPAVAQRQPHYGRFLDLKAGELVRMTWVTGDAGTKGAETVVSVALKDEGSNTALTLTHSGFLDHKSMQQHAEAWPVVLKHLESQLSAIG